MTPILFARRDSIYKKIHGTDVYDIDRDARTWPGGAPGVYHPPCRAWGRLRQFSKPRPDERALATWSVDQIRKYGGVLEHPAASSLWREYGLPRPGEGRDAWGGWSLDVNQNWWGHKATKRTWLYVCGCEPKDMPQLPYVLGEGTHIVASSRRYDKEGRRVKHWKKELSKAAREATPIDFAHWLIELAERCKNVEKL